MRQKMFRLVSTVLILAGGLTVTLSTEYRPLVECRTFCVEQCGGCCYYPYPNACFCC
jgi:hypothetical protein